MGIAEIVYARESQLETIPPLLKAPSKSEIMSTLCEGEDDFVDSLFLLNVLVDDIKIVMLAEIEGRFGSIRLHVAVCLDAYVVLRNCRRETLLTVGEVSMQE